MSFCAAVGVCIVRYCRGRHVRAKYECPVLSLSAKWSVRHPIQHAHHIADNIEYTLSSKANVALLSMLHNRRVVNLMDTSISTVDCMLYTHA